MAYTGLADTAFNEGVESGEFPQPFIVSQRTSLWLKAEWDEWVQRKLANREADKAKRNAERAKKQKVKAKVSA
jgi:predicted DNA-binding transcriptional regulator AlpA